MTCKIGSDLIKEYSKKGSTNSIIIKNKITDTNYSINKYKKSVTILLNSFRKYEICD